MVDQVTFRTTDVTRWGTGLGTPLSKVQIDINFWTLLSRVITLEEHQLIAARGIDTVFQHSGHDDAFYVLLTDGTQQGPFYLPVFDWNFTNSPTGTWLPSFPYIKNDVFNYSNVMYLVNLDHTSGLTFDPNATDGHGNLLYKTIMNFHWTLAGAGDVSLTSPLENGQVLTWSSLLSGWTNEFFTLSSLSDVSLLSPFDNGDVLVWNVSLGKWVSAERAVATASVANQFLTGINSDGSATQAQPAFSNISGIATPAQVRAPVDVLTASASISLDPTANDVFTLTPTSDCTITPTAAPAGARITLLVTTSGTTSYNISFASPFVAKGSLVTGNATAKKWSVTFAGDGTNFVEVSRTALPERLFTMEVSASDETTALTTGTGVITFYMPADVDLTDCFIGLTTQSASGAVQADVKKTGTTVFSTKPSVGASQNTSLTGSGSVQAVLTSNPTTLTKGDKMTIDIVTAGTTAAGLKVVLIGYYR